MKRTNDRTSFVILEVDADSYDLDTVEESGDFWSHDGYDAVYFPTIQVEYMGYDKEDRKLLFLAEYDPSREPTRAKYHGRIVRYGDY